MCITVTTMRTQKSSITKTHVTSNSPNTSHVCWFHSPAFSEWHINGSLQHMAFLNWLSFSTGAATRMVVVSQRAVFQVRLPQWVGPVIHLMDDVRIVFLKTIFWSFSRAPMLQLKLSAAKLNKQTNNSILWFQFKKNPGGKGNTKIWYHRRMEKNRRNTHWISIHYPAAGL